jgi:hypothetical protein
MGPEDVSLIGWTCNVIGLFFLANSILFLKLRKLMEELFGVGSASLAALKDHVLNKTQVVVGFLFLTSGCVILGMVAWAGSTQPTLTVVVCLSLLVFAALLYVILSVYSRRTFERYLVEFFRHHAEWPFKEEMALTKEVGAVLGVENQPNETVDDYVHKVRVKLKLPVQPAAPAVVSDRARRLREMAPVPTQNLAIERPR